MSKTIEKAVEVEVPVRTAYNQWTQFEDFPEFMEGVEKVEQLDDATLRWTADIAGADREWTAEITEQRPDERIAWKASGETEHAGVVTFHKLGDEKTRVMLQLTVDPNTFTEKVANALSLTDQRVEGDMKRFKDFIEERGGQETGAWRGEIDQDPTS